MPTTKGQVNACPILSRYPLLDSRPSGAKLPRLIASWRLFRCNVPQNPSARFGYHLIMTNAGLSHEQEVVRAFILKDRRERCTYLLGHPKHRRKFTEELPHFKWLDERFAHPIPPSTAHTAAELVSLLRRKGAGPTVWVISDDRAIDAQEMPLDTAMSHIWGRQIGTILSCVPGKLAFFAGEEMKSERLLLRP